MWNKQYRCEHLCYNSPQISGPVSYFRLSEDQDCNYSQQGYITGIKQAVKSKECVLCFKLWREKDLKISRVAQIWLQKSHCHNFEGNMPHEPDIGWKDTNFCTIILAPVFPTWPTKPNLTYQTKADLPNPTFQIQHDLSNPTWPIKTNHTYQTQADLTNPIRTTKPNLTYNVHYIILTLFLSLMGIKREQIHMFSSFTKHCKITCNHLKQQLKSWFLSKWI